MKMESLVKKIKELRVNGDNKFCVEVDGSKYEFKAIEVAGEEWKVFGGYAISLRTYHKNYPAEQIAEDFRMAIKGVDLDIEKATFISPITFA